MGENVVEEKKKAIELQFPLLLIRTIRGLKTLDRMGGWIGTKWLGWLVLLIMPIIAILGLYIITNSVSVLFSNALARSYVRSFTPLANLLIPGLNPYLPIAYGWIALVVGLVAHEAAHGVLARNLKFQVKSAGLLLLTIIPIGAFVEVDDKALRKAKARDSGRVFAAGPGSNVVVALVSLTALLLVLGSISPIVDGFGVTSITKDYPGDNVGLDPGDIIFKINGINISNWDDVTFALDNVKPNDTVNMKVGKISNKGILSIEEFDIIAVGSPSNESKGYIGFSGVGLKDSLEGYRNFGRASPFIYLIWPTFSGANQQVIPFSDSMFRFYTSPIGSDFNILANLFFWIWFVNFNLAIFNALPIYPLDGGQALRAFLQSTIGRKIGDKSVSRLTMGVTFIVLMLIGSMLIFPYLI